MEFFPAYPPTFWAVAIFTILLIGITKAGIGGLGGVTMALMALVMPVPEAAALLLPLLLIADSFSVYHYATLKSERAFHRPSLLTLLPCAVIGIFIGGFFFNSFSDNERLLKVSIGLFALIFLAYQLLQTTIIGSLAQRKLPKSIGWLLGALAGFTSTIVHAGAPLIAIYMLPQKLPRHIYVGTTLIFFLLVNLIKLIPYTYLGLLQIGNLTTVLLLSPFCYVGVRLGIYLNQRSSELWFNRIIYGLLLITGIQLVSGQNLIELLQ